MDFKEVYPYTCSTVSVAAREGNEDALKALLSKGKPYDVKDNRGWTCIHEAASAGHVQCLNTLLELEDVDVDVRTFEWETALMLASANGHADCVTCLIKHGADPNSHTHDIDTALCRAAKENQIDCIKALISGGADVNKKYFTEDSPLHIAVSQHGDRGAVSCLIDAGADLFSTNEHELTPLFLAAQFGHCDILKLFIETVISTKGEEAVRKYIEMAAYDSATPLYVAAQGGFANCVEVLLKYGADPCRGLKETQGNSVVAIYPLQVAIYRQSFRCFQQLLDSLDFVLKEYDNNESLQTDYLEYHPYILAQGCSDPCFLRMLLDKNRLTIDSLPNIFHYPMDLTCAVLYMKMSKEWMMKMFKSYVCRPGFLTVGKDICLLMLRHGQDKSLVETLHFNLFCPVYQSAWGEDSLLLMLIKYLHGYCLGDACSSRCIFKRMSSDLPVYAYLMRLCLMTHISSLKAVGGNVREETNGKDDGPDLEKLKAKISEVLVSNSLQHNCRMVIVLRLVKSKKYNERSIDSLNIPEMMKDYLKYTEYGEIGEKILTGFEALDEEERSVDETVTAEFDMN